MEAAGVVCMQKYILIIMLIFTVALSSCTHMKQADFASTPPFMEDETSSSSYPFTSSISPSLESNNSADYDHPDTDPPIIESPAVGNGSELNCSSDDRNYLNGSPVTMDFNGDGFNETLTIIESDQFDYDDDGMVNNLTQIKLSIGKREIIYESTWNDGINVRISDFNVNDPYLDIYLEILGTDIATTFLIYRFDGENLKFYLGFHAEDVSFSYDAKGMIYYDTFIPEESLDTEKYVHVTLDYVSKEKSYEDAEILS